MLPETLSRLLSGWQKRRWLQSQRCHWTMLDAAPLQRLAGAGLHGFQSASNKARLPTRRQQRCFGHAIKCPASETTMLGYAGICPDAPTLYAP